MSLANNPPLPLTYPDIVATPDVDPLARETASDLQTLIQDVMHILQEDLGSNMADPNRGVGIFRWLSGTNLDLAKLQAVIQTQLADDPRLDSVACQITQNNVGIYPWTILVNLGVNGAVLPVTFGWSNATGLVAIT